MTNEQIEEVVDAIRTAAATYAGGSVALSSDRASTIVTVRLIRDAPTGDPLLDSENARNAGGE